MGVYTVKPGWGVPLPLGFFCSKDKRLFHQPHPIPLACLSLTNPQAIGSCSHTDTSLKLISCYVFTGISGLTMQRDFSHLIERNFWLCVGMSAMVRSWTVSSSSHFWWLSSSLPLLPLPGILPVNFLLPSGSDFSGYHAVSKPPFLQPGWWVPHEAHSFGDPTPEPALLLPRPAWASSVVTLSFPYLDSCTEQEKVEWTHIYFRSFFREVLLNMQNKVRAAFISDLFWLLSCIC